jgi:hypothetical protein
MTEPQICAPGAGDTEPWELLVDESTRVAAEAIAAWQAAAKRLVDSGAGGVMAVAVVTAATWWFDWAKGWQAVPYVGGAGRPGPANLTPTRH